jgi:hypothetical protein
MMQTRTTVLFTLKSIAVASWVWLTGSATACPFCSVQGQTLAGEVNQADLIVLGTLKNPKADPQDFAKGTTELHIESVVKDHPFLKGKTMLVLPRYIRVDPKQPVKTLVFCGLYAPTRETAGAAVASSLVLADPLRYTLDPYRGDELEPDSKLPQYLQGAAAVREKDVITRLNYFFRFLDSPESKISSDAYLEFANADYKDVRTVAENVSPDKLLSWLNDANTPPSRFGLYGLMIGHSCKSEHAAALRAILDDPKKQYSSGLDGLMAGYILLDPKGGWEYTRTIAADEKKDFQVRYAALRVLRFLWETRPDVVAKDQVLEGMKLLVMQADIADLPMEDLRKWEQYQLMPFVLEQGAKESHKQFPIVRRAVLRFAVTAEGKDKLAAEFVKRSEGEEPDRVKLVREMLADERPKK